MEPRFADGVAGRSDVLDLRALWEAEPRVIYVLIALNVIALVAMVGFGWKLVQSVGSLVAASRAARCDIVLLGRRMETLERDAGIDGSIDTWRKPMGG